jgi:hypothetical protein
MRNRRLLPRDVGKPVSRNLEEKEKIAVKRAVICPNGHTFIVKGDAQPRREEVTISLDCPECEASCRLKWPMGGPYGVTIVRGVANKQHKEEQRASASSSGLDLQN